VTLVRLTWRFRHLLWYYRPVMWQIKGMIVMSMLT